MHRVRFGFLAVLMALAGAPSAHAQSAPSAPSTGGVSIASVSLSPSGVSLQVSGVSLEVDPQQGATVGVDAGEAGAVGVGAGPQGVTLDLSNSPVQLPTTESGSEPPQRSGGASGSQPSSGGGRAPRLETGPAEPDRSADAPGATNSNTPRSAQSARETGSSTDRTAQAATPDRRVTAEPTTSREKARSVAPFLDFIEEIPRAVWAGLIALAMIALAMWLMWVRGRRQLEKNAYVDADSGVTNVAAFETLLAGEWARAVRYRRPLGLLLLELEDLNPADSLLGGRRLRVARDAIQDSVRDADTVAQLSGSRFAVITPEAAHGSVQTLARAIERSLEVASVRVSVGVGDRLETDRGPADLVARAAASLGKLPQPGAEEVVEPPTEDVRRPALHVAA